MLNLSSPFIHRPIGTTLLAIGLAIAGCIAFILLPTSALPQIDFPTISVQASLPGASPEVMATSVATPLERQLSRISGITQMTSTSTKDNVKITIQFDLERDINGAARDVQAAINAAASDLPANLPIQPTYRKVNPADAPIMILSLTSDIYSTGQMYDVASTQIQQKLSQVNGVGQVQVGGSSLPAVRVELNPTALNHYDISLENVRSVLNAANVNHPKGQLSNQKSTTNITTNDQLFKARDYLPLIIAYHNSAPIRLADIAEVNDSVEDIRNTGIADGKSAVIIIISKEPGANVINTIDNLTATLPQLLAALPAAMKMDIVIDRSATIRASLHDIEITLVIAIVLVVLVTLIFLGNLRAMLISGVAVPLSLLGTCSVMYLLGYSLNNLSLMALTISTGFVVDDVVVVLENIERYLEMKMTPLQAALIGAQEVGFTVLSMSFSLIAVFIPILFMGGIIGRLFREFAVTLAIAIFISLIVSLTVTPMMCGQLLKTTSKNTNNRYTIFLQRINHGYEKSLYWALKHSWLMITLTSVCVLLSIYLYIAIPKGFFPQQDTGRITGTIQADQNISFQSMQNKLSALIKVIKTDPAIAHAVGFVGSGTANTGMVYIALKPLADRHVTATDVIDRLRGKLNRISGTALYLQPAQDLVIGGRQSGAQFQYTFTGDNLTELNHWIPQVQKKLQQLPSIADVNSDQRDHGLQLFVTIDRDTASRFGISAEVIDNTLNDAFGQRQVSTLYTEKNQYHVVMEVAPVYWQQPESLRDIYIPSLAEQMVPLTTIANFNPTTTLLSVNHQGQAPAATLSFNLLSNVALGDAVELVSSTIASMQLSGSIHGSFQGTAQAFEASLKNEPMLIFTALLAVYIILGMLYESLIHPITILSTLPSAGVGALLALTLTKTELNLIGLIGIILLIGIVKKNAIMMIDFAIALEKSENITSLEAIYRAAKMRFRPIMMTTAAATFGALPLVIGTGLGSELRHPLGISIIGGLIVSQLLTLYTTPVIYLQMDKAGIWCRNRFSLRKSMQDLDQPSL